MSTSRAHGARRHKRGTRSSAGGDARLPGAGLRLVVTVMAHSGGCGLCLEHMARSPRATHTTQFAGRHCLAGHSVRNRYQLQPRLAVFRETSRDERGMRLEPIKVNFTQIREVLMVKNPVLMPDRFGSTGLVGITIGSLFAKESSRSIKRKKTRKRRAPAAPVREGRPSCKG